MLYNIGALISPLVLVTVDKCIACTKYQENGENYPCTLGLMWCLIRSIRQPFDGISHAKIRARGTPFNASKDIPNALKVK
jgi:hypothetical protein